VASGQLLVTHRILPGDCCEVMAGMGEKSVHMVCTSPPYWGLRSYLGKDDPLKPRELGCERVHDCLGWATGQRCGECYVCHLTAVFGGREQNDGVWRVLRDDGLLFLNLGDSYYASPAGNKTPSGISQNTPKRMGKLDEYNTQRKELPGLKPLDLVGIPWRVAMSLQAAGWYLRSSVIWAKATEGDEEGGSTMPGSMDGWRWERHRVKVKAKWGPENPHPSTGRDGGRSQFGEHSGYDVKHEAEWADCPGCPKCDPNDGLVFRKGSWRPTTAHEYLFMFSKTDCYFADKLAVVERDKGQHGSAANFRRTTKDAVHPNQSVAQHRLTRTDTMATGMRNPRDVWILNPEPSNLEHFAQMPSRLIEPCVKVGTSLKGVCPKCGAPWVRVVERPSNPSKPANTGHDFYEGMKNMGGNHQTSEGLHRNDGNAESGPSRTLGWRPSCECKWYRPKSNIPKPALDKARSLAKLSTWHTTSVSNAG